MATMMRQNHRQKCPRRNIGIGLWSHEPKNDLVGSIEDSIERYFSTEMTAECGIQV